MTETFVFRSGVAGVPNFSLNFLKELLSEKPEKNVVTKTDNLFVQKQTAYAERSP